MKLSKEIKELKKSIKNDYKKLQKLVKQRAEDDLNVGISLQSFEEPESKIVKKTRKKRQKKRVVVTEDIKETVLQMLSDNKSTASILRKTKISDASLWRIKKSLGLTRSYKKGQA